MDKEFLLSVLVIFLAGLLAGLYLAYRAFTHGASWQRHLRRYDQVIKAHIKTDDGRQGWFIELPERQLLKLKLLAAGVLAGKSLTGSTWAGHGKLFSRADWESMVELMLSRDWVRWINPEIHNRGLEFTRSGRAAFRCLAGKNTPPPFQPFTQPGARGMSVTDTHTRT